MIAPIVWVVPIMPEAGHIHGENYKLHPPCNSPAWEPWSTRESVDQILANDPAQSNLTPAKSVVGLGCSREFLETTSAKRNSPAERIDNNAELTN
jgi:hypothetical protein